MCTSMYLAVLFTDEFRHSLEFDKNLLSFIQITDVAACASELVDKETKEAESQKKSIVNSAALYL